MFANLSARQPDRGGYGLGHRSDVTCGDESTGRAADELGDAAARKCHDRGPARHRFSDDEAVRLVPGRGDKCRRSMTD
jgi:hypothetical protein